MCGKGTGSVFMYQMIPGLRDAGKRQREKVLWMMATYVLVVLELEQRPGP